MSGFLSLVLGLLELFGAEKFLFIVSLAFDLWVCRCYMYKQMLNLFGMLIACS